VDVDEIAAEAQGKVFPPLSLSRLTLVRSMISSVFRKCEFRLYYDVATSDYQTLRELETLRVLQVGAHVSVLARLPIPPCHGEVIAASPPH
jgi:hypothetical protein